ncbi:MAG: tRNA lysidine(34) synthetase TilS, partial [Catalinimonas sp.]
SDLRQAAWRVRGEVITVRLEPVRRSAAPAFLLAELLRELNFDDRDAGAMLSDDHPGRSFRSATHHLVTDRDQVVITPLRDGPTEKVAVGKEAREVHWAAGHLQIELVGAKGYVPEADPHTASLDAGRLRFPLELRSWQAGDRFRPLGMRGTKKLSDFLVEQRVPRNLKPHVWVLTSGGAVVWVVGRRIDECYRIGPTTERVWRARFVPRAPEPPAV